MVEIQQTVYITEIIFVELPFSFQATALTDSQTCIGSEIIHSIEDEIDLIEARSALESDDDVIPFE